MGGDYESLPRRSNVCCYCCYMQPLFGAPRYLFTCTPCRLTCCIFGAVLALLLAAELWIGSTVGQAFVEKHTRLEQNITDCILSTDELQNGQTFCGPDRGLQRTPAKITDTMWFPACTNTHLVHEMAAYNLANSWSYVQFASRQGSVGQEPALLGGWWLPVADSAAPRVVIVHGGNRNINDWTVQVAAYMLRSIGFAVLLTSLRDHGPSANASRPSKISWGWAYHLDVLGAWDFAVGDPQGVLGGVIKTEDVGLMGFGVGGFAAAIAAGMEEQVPAVWLDSAVFEPQNILKHELNKVVGSLAPLFTSAAWFFARRSAQMDLTHRTPSNTVPLRNVSIVQCRVAAVAGLQDAVVPTEETNLLVSLFKANNITYVVHEDFQGPASCGATTHAVLMVWRPDEYRAKLCHFWTRTFGLHFSACQLTRLPEFGMNVFARSGWQDEPPELRYI